MRDHISQKAKGFQRNISPVREIMLYADKDYLRKEVGNIENLISFAGGWVNHEAPKELQESYRQIVNNEDLFHQSGGYSPTLGMNEFKTAVAKFENYLYGLKDIAKNNIAVGLGSTQLTMDLFEVLLDPDDSILLTDPSYCNYPTQVLTGIMNVKILRFPVLDGDKWEYNADKKADEFYNFILAKKPKLTLLISPDNPTSQVLPEEFVQGGLEAMKKVEGFLVIDFAYKELVFKGGMPDYFRMNYSDNYIILRSNSKWCRGLGRRLGWIIAPDFVTQAMESIQNSTILCPDTLHQMAMTSYIEKATADDSLKLYLEDVREKYRKAAECTISAINTHVKRPALTPQGGLYTCMKIGDDGAKFVNKVLKEASVLLIPGWGFGRTVKNAVRICYGPMVNDLDRIEEGIKRVAKCLNG